MDAACVKPVAAAVWGCCVWLWGFATVARLTPKSSRGKRGDVSQNRTMPPPCIAHPHTLLLQAGHRMLLAFLAKARARAAGRAVCVRVLRTHWGCRHYRSQDAIRGKSKYPRLKSIASQNTQTKAHQKNRSKLLAARGGRRGNRRPRGYSGEFACAFDDGEQLLLCSRSTATPPPQSIPVPFIYHVYCFFFHLHLAPRPIESNASKWLPSVRIRCAARMRRGWMCRSIDRNPQPLSLRLFFNMHTPKSPPSSALGPRGAHAGPHAHASVQTGAVEGASCSGAADGGCFWLDFVL